MATDPRPSRPASAHTAASQPPLLARWFLAVPLVRRTDARAPAPRRAQIPLHRGAERGGGRQAGVLRRAVWRSDRRGRAGRGASNNREGRVIPSGVTAGPGTSVGGTAHTGHAPGSAARASATAIAARSGASPDPPNEGCRAL